MVGHCLPAPPGQLAGTVSTPFVQDAARHEVAADFVTSAGQLVVLPLQTSARSQVPEAARQVLVKSEQAPLEQL
jgi:hypothetical protein